VTIVTHIAEEIRGTCYVAGRGAINTRRGGAAACSLHPKTDRSRAALPELWAPLVSEIIIEISLNRPSGMLAVIVASPAQAASRKKADRKAAFPRCAIAKPRRRTG